MKIKVKITLDIITEENKYIVCDKIKEGFKVLLGKNMPSLVYKTGLKTDEPLYNISVTPLWY